jgi:hypothetical protein
MKKQNIHEYIEGFTRLLYILNTMNRIRGILEWFCSTIGRKKQLYVNQLCSYTVCIIEPHFSNHIKGIVS